MQNIDTITTVAKQFASTYNQIEKDMSTLDQIECDLAFLNEDRIVKIKNNLELYNDEISRLFLEDGVLVLKEKGRVVNKVFFHYKKDEQGIVFLSKNLKTQFINGGTFRFNKNGELDVRGAISKEEFYLYEKVLNGIGGLSSGQDEYTKMRNAANNLVIDMASILLYIDFIAKYKKEFITVTNKAINTPRNPKKKKTKGSPKKKVNIIKKFVIQSDMIRKYEKEQKENIYERHMESWTVSGHWRKIKGGKEKIWIAPYTKGDPSKKKGKVYTVK